MRGGDRIENGELWRKHSTGGRSKGWEGEGQRGSTSHCSKLFFLVFIRLSQGTDLRSSGKVLSVLRTPLLRKRYPKEKNRFPSYHKGTTGFHLPIMTPAQLHLDKIINEEENDENHFSQHRICRLDAICIITLRDK